MVSKRLARGAALVCIYDFGTVYVAQDLDGLRLLWVLSGSACILIVYII